MYTMNEEECLLYLSGNTTHHLKTLEKPAKDLIERLTKIEMRCPSEEGIQRYFEYLSECRVMMVNGVLLSGETDFYCECDYCGRNIDVIDYYYCWDCHKDMCKFCHSETSEEVALANGAKNYQKRKDALNACRDHRVVKRSMGDIVQEGDLECDVCSESIDRSDGLWSNLGGWSKHDACLKCGDTEEGQKFIEERSLRRIGLQQDEYEKQWKNTEFGPLDDWVPVLEDSHGAIILQNLDSNSPLHNRFAAMAPDDHGRCGCYTLPQTTLDELITILEGVHKPSTENSWEEYYNSPIRRLMVKYHMAIRFG